MKRKSPPRSTIELALQSILSELNDTSPYIEYWVRNPSKGPRSLEAHRDIDEGLCTKHVTPISLGSDVKIGKQRCPNNGHVLYVEVDGDIGSPTLIWEEEGGASPGPPKKISSIWTVPSVTNRLLRFDGNCLHAVAYPPFSFLKGNDIDGEGESDNHSADRAINGDKNGKRAVILFNTWDEPPMYPSVGEDLSIGETTNYAELKDEDEHPFCLEFDCWNASPITMKGTDGDVNNGNMQTSILSVPLLGSQLRRACEASSLDVKVQTEDATLALSSSATVVGIDAID